MAMSNEWFWSHFSDGRAEVNGYTLIQPRYGQLRHGHAVMIFVTEPFSRARGVKVDRYEPNNVDHFIALKLNHLRHFQTGVYDYSLMTSVFSEPAAGMRTHKVAFGAQEWCGLTWETTRWLSDSPQLRIESYFDGESSTTELQDAGESEDAIWILARGLLSGGPGHQGLGSPVVGNAATRRLKHLPAQSHDAHFKWKGKAKRLVPAGEFDVRIAEWTRADRVRCTIDIEITPPYRVVSCACDDGEAGRLTGSKRLAYWEKSKLKDEELLKGLGLPLRRPPSR